MLSLMTIESVLWSIMNLFKMDILNDKTYVCMLVCPCCRLFYLNLTGTTNKIPYYTECCTEDMFYATYSQFKI